MFGIVGIVVSIEYITMSNNCIVFLLINKNKSPVIYIFLCIYINIVIMTTGEFETGFEKGGQTREHALLAKTLGK